ncbi:MAG: ankyrin repeat domain-containing protein, partial [Opitutaceae bacterium]|nr:ankyrin repeat domain-containing protein [Opitutaceae bacterium]
MKFKREIKHLLPVGIFLICSVAALFIKNELISNSFFIAGTAVFVAALLVLIIREFRRYGWKKVDKGTWVMLILLAGLVTAAASVSFDSDLANVASQVGGGLMVVSFLIIIIFHFSPDYSSDHPDLSAFKDGTLKQLKRLLENERCLRAEDDDGDNALIVAAKNNPYPEVLRAVVHAGFDVNEADEFTGQTALMAAAWNNPNPAVIKALIELGADMSAQSDKGQTAIFYAAKHNKNPDVLKALLDAGA